MSEAASSAISDLKIEQLMNDLRELTVKAQMIEGERNALIEIVNILLDRLCQK